MKKCSYFNKNVSRIFTINYTMTCSLSLPKPVKLKLLFVIVYSTETFSCTVFYHSGFTVSLLPLMIFFSIYLRSGKCLLRVSEVDDTEECYGLSLRRIGPDSALEL